MGGTRRLDTDTLPNLLALDPIVHNGGPGSVHADRRGRSGPNGWLVSKLNDRPGDVPVLLRPTPEFEQWFILTEAGLRLPISAMVRVRLQRPLPVVER